MKAKRIPTVGSAGIVVGWILFSSLGVCAPPPPAERLFPQDTLLLFSIPSVKAWNATSERSPAMQLWADPAMRPFREKLTKKFESEVIKPIENALQIRFSDYTNLITGQFSVAVLNREGISKKGPGFVVVADAGEKGAVLSSNLQDIRRKWLDAGNKISSERIRGTDFTVFVISPEKVERTFQKIFKSDEKEALDRLSNQTNSSAEGHLYVGQKDSVLVVGNDANLLAGIVAGLEGRSAQTLADLATFSFCNSFHLRKAQAYVWVNMKGFMDLLNKLVEETKRSSGMDEAGGMVSFQEPKPSEIFDALGLAGVRAISFAYIDTPEGSYGEALMFIPAADRKGLFELFTGQRKDVSPPEFIPADVISMARWRINGAQAWTSFTKSLSKIMPIPLTEMIIPQLNMAVRQKNPNFDFERDFVQNLGDDFIVYRKAPRSTRSEDLMNPPEIYLIGAPNPEKFVSTIREMIEALLGPKNVEEREVAGRKIYTVTGSTGSRQATGRKVSFAAAGGYVGFSTDDALMEEFVRQKKPDTRLRENQQFMQALQKLELANSVGISYTDEAAAMRAILGALKQNGGTVTNILDLFQLPLDDEEKAKVASWIDVSLLPPFEKIAKYFHFQVNSVFTTPEAIVLRTFAPTPPGLKK